MLATAATTLLALVVSSGLLMAGAVPPVAALHLAFAVGIVPLIFAAMSHFVPVLTRSGSPARGIALVPAGAQAAGLAAFAAMAGLVPRGFLLAAATADALLAAVLLAWIIRRSRACLGTPHPGWRWYPAALACLILALAAVPPLLSVPGLYLPLRIFHLHLNTLGLVGLAAFGTLPVLLPTALGKPDPQAAPWLRRRVWPVAAGALLVAVGAAFFWPLAAVGAAMLFGIALSLAGQWWRHYGPGTLVRDGAAASLAAAVVGFLGLQVAGVAHGAGLLSARPAVVAWGAAFLLPLVTGALTQLLPVWRWPGPVIPARAVMRARLAATGPWRGLLFLLAGGLLAADFALPGGVLAVAGLALFALGVVRAVGVSAAAR